MKTAGGQVLRRNSAQSSRIPLGNSQLPVLRRQQGGQRTELAEHRSAITAIRENVTDEVSNQSSAHSMFQHASGTNVSGGVFTNHAAPSTSTTVHLHVYSGKPGQSQIENLASETQEEQGIQNSRCENREEPITICPSGSGTCSFSRTSDSSSTNLTQGSNINDTDIVVPARRTHQEIYKAHLAHEAYGTPLWIPSPNLRSPPQYRMKGVSVCDVGMFTPEGGFDQLFNANLSADDPANCLRVPENLTPLHPPLNLIDVREFREFTSKSYVTSSLISITSEKNSGHTTAINFESSATEGAVLVMPEGAHVEQLNNHARLQQYITHNAEIIYGFVMNTLGRSIENGDLRFVYGCRKSTSFGLAVFSEPPQGNSTRLRFCFGEHDNTGGSGEENTRYQWDYSGAVAVKTGPECGENHGLEANNDATPRNQTLFTSTFSVKLSDQAWEKLEAERSGILDSGIKSMSVPCSGVHTIEDRGAGMSSVQPLKLSENGSRKGEQQSLPMVTDSMENTHLLHQDTADPRAILHKILMEKAPSAKVSIVSERDYLSQWISMGDIVEAQSETLIDRVCSSNNILEQDGAVYFEPKDPSVEQDINEISHSIALDNFTLEHYLFGNMSKESHFDGLLDLIEDIKAFKCAPNWPPMHLSPVSLHGHPNRPFSLDEISTGNPASTSIASLRQDVLYNYNSSTNINDLVSTVQHLADCLYRRYLCHAQLEDLNEAIWYYEILCFLLPIDHYHYLELLLSLSPALYQRLQLLQQSIDQEKLVQCLEKQCQLNFSQVSQSFETVVSGLRTRHHVGKADAGPINTCGHHEDGNMAYSQCNSPNSLMDQSFLELSRPYAHQPTLPGGSPTSSGGGGYRRHRNLPPLINNTTGQFTSYHTSSGPVNYLDRPSSDIPSPQAHFCNLLDMPITYNASSSFNPRSVPGSGVSLMQMYQHDMVDVDEYLNLPRDSPPYEHAFPSQQSMGRRPTNEETEQYLRNSLGIRAPNPLSLAALPDEPLGAKHPKISEMIKLAIWGSPQKKLTLRQIYEAIESRYPSLKQRQDKPWQRSIRHNLSLKAMFVRVERPSNHPGKGYYWTLDISQGEGNKRDRQRKEGRGGQDVKEEDDSDDLMSDETPENSQPYYATLLPMDHPGGGPHQQSRSHYPQQKMFLSTGKGSRQYHGHPVMAPQSHTNPNMGYPDFDRTRMHNGGYPEMLSIPSGFSHGGDRSVFASNHSYPSTDPAHNIAMGISPSQLQGSLRTLRSTDPSLDDRREDFSGGSRQRSTRHYTN